ncbi:hypothetical protein FHL15_003786 [Xylaria flabelliformis]|uniref:Uncharacterized protein n=1 Tax=Xylaria flabelliformis TaxID=2512241 RepID=A0A553I5H4_9PEZI|nr:hypothetical protein FHL15_003786 [Xylaria flabelliformis]
MDKDWQDALFESWDNSDVVLGRRDSDDTRTNPSPVKAPSRGTRDGEDKSRTVKKRKGRGGLANETGMRTEVMIISDEARHACRHARIPA